MGLDRAEVEKLVGRESGAIRALDAVSKSDIRHWCELIGDGDPDYHDRVRRGEKTAPPAMLLAWTMDPLWPPRGEAAAREPHEELDRLFREAGYDGATGIGLDQEFLRPLRIGDRLSFRVKVLAVSPDEEKTRLGTGYLVDLGYSLVNQDGEPVSSQTQRVLRYRTLTP